ncbi:MAG: NAD(P)-binding protein, partial [Gemmatimonadota bacterium]
MTGEGERTRVAVLGGGPAGLAAAFGLSATAELRDRYEVTVYQAGWRVGGKCGQGRERDRAWRIEQNGTHYVFGAYDNVFRTARQAFDELEAAGDHRFGTFDSNFIARNLLAMKQFFGGEWTTWAVELWGNDLKPGGEAEELTLGRALEKGIAALIEHHGRHAEHARPRGPGGSERPPEHETWVERIAELIGRQVDDVEDLVGVGLLHVAHHLAGLVDEAGLRDPALRAIVWLLERFRAFLRDLLHARLDTHVGALRLWVMADFGISALLGIIEDDVFAPGRMAGLDRYDLREWLARHGASERTLYSAPVITWYNAIAAYEDGDVSRPDMSAAAGLQAMLRLGMTYKGAFAYQMSHEVGESVVAPVYQVLKNRGVRFMFFHRVWDVRPSETGDAIDVIEVERQVELKSGNPASYEPFVTLPGTDRPVWPSTPLAEQIEGPCDFEPALDSFYTPHRGPRHALRRGADFDVVVYALPAASLPRYCAGLIEQRPEW